VIDKLDALFTRHFMGDATNRGAWRIVPRPKGSELSHLKWFEDHGKDSLREQFWVASRLALICSDEIEATSILLALETDYMEWVRTQENDDV